MKTLIMTALLAALIAPQAAIASTPATDKEPEAKVHYQDDSQVEAVLDVLEAYKQALNALDRTAFQALFYSQTAPIYGVYRGADSKDVGIRLHGFDYIDRLIGGNYQPEQKFWNLDIRVDGLIAVITSDFSFHIDGEKTNWGTESWHLVHTEGGWKILTIIFSIKP